MRERSGGKAVEERLLFHGTDHSLLEAICEQNFDWRMCGVHGTLYGKGECSWTVQLKYRAVQSVNVTPQCNKSMGSRPASKRASAHGF